MSSSASGPTARNVWTIMSDLVLDNERRQAVSEAIGLPFGRAKALRRIAASPRTPGELAVALGIDPPNCTIVIDDLERRGLVERQPHPTDRRSKLIVATALGARLAKQANTLLSEPPSALLDLSDADLNTLAEILARVEHQPRVL